MRTIQLIVLIAGLAFMTSCFNDNPENLSPFEQYQIDQQIITDYLADNNITTLEDSVHGLRYEVLIDSGSSVRPDLSDIVNVNYAGNVLGQTATFDSGNGVQFPLANLIVGWQVLIPYMGVGDKIRMYLPSGYAYGSRGSGSIGPNSILVFDVTLNGLGQPEVLSYEEQLVVDQQIISKYLSDNNINVQMDSVFGLRYELLLDSAGTRNPSTSSTINVDYAGRVLGITETFDSGNAVEFSLANEINGWRVLIPYMSAGDSIRMYLPSGFAYGKTGSGDIPRNANLVFDVKLNSFE